MSEKKFQTQEDLKLSKYPHSDKSAISSSQDSYSRRQEVAKLRNHLQIFTSSRDLAKELAEKFEKEADFFERYGKTELSLETRIVADHQFEDYAYYNKAALEMEKRIKWITLRYAARQSKKENYVRIRIKYPPSDQE